MGERLSLSLKAATYPSDAQEEQMRPALHPNLANKHCSRAWDIGAFIYRRTVVTLSCHTLPAPLVSQPSEDEAPPVTCHWQQGASANSELTEARGRPKGRSGRV